MKTVKITLGIELIDNNVSLKEERPQISIFLDARFKRKPIVTDLTTKDVTITGKVDPRLTTLPQTAALCFSAFAIRQNDFKSKCLMDIGTNHIALASITNDELHQYDLPLVMHTVDNLVKLKLRITIKNIDMDGIKIVDEKFIGSGISQYINNSMKQESNMPDTIAGTSNMHIPYNFSEPH